MADVVVLELGPLFTLDEVKEHLRIDSADEDTLIEAYMEAAVSTLLMYCNAAIVPVGAEAAFKVAGLMTVSRMYEAREGGDEGLSLAARSLINPYRNLRV